MAPRHAQPEQNPGFNSAYSTVADLEHNRSKRFTVFAANLSLNRQLSCAFVPRIDREP
jgi:hypothetical protein